MPTIVLKTKIDGKDVEYTGRFLGFIKDDEFNALTQHPDEVGTRLESKATQSLTKVAASKDKLSGVRLIMAIKKVGTKTTFIKKLFVSDRLDFISEVAGKIVTIEAEGGHNTLVVEEKE
jgi:hypothetical protein